MGLSVERNRAACYRVIQAEVTRLCLETKKRPVLLIDEAHHLRNDVLEDLRLLTNFELDSQSRLSLLLVGLPEIRRRLRMAIHESFEQRIILKHHLKGLAREEMGDYLTHHLRRVGSESPIFSPDSQEALYQATNGMPRRINRLAHYSLIAALADKSTTVTAAHIETAASEIEL
jgi:type II secretory pathway predicted ATPase ExeA